MLVLVNPITKKPTAFSALPERQNIILDGPYQNAVEVTEEWVTAERDRLGRDMLENCEEWSRYPERIAEAAATERERCAKVAESIATNAQDLQVARGTAALIALLIRSGK